MSRKKTKIHPLDPSELTPKLSGLVEFSTPWGFDDDDLKTIPVAARFGAAVTRFTPGLQTVVLDCTHRDEEGHLIRDRGIQTFTFPHNNRTFDVGEEPTPAFEDVHLVAQMITRFGMEYAEARGILGTFTVRFYGYNPEINEQERFQKQSNFRVDGRPRLREDGEDEDEDDDELDTEPAMLPGIGRVQMPQVSFPVPDGASPETAFLASVAQTLIQQQNGFMSVVLQLQGMQFAQQSKYLADQTKGQRVVVRLLKDANEGIRDQYDLAFSSIHETYERSLAELRGEVIAARGEADKAHGKLIRATEQKEAHLLGQQEASRQSWDAFTSAMQMQFQAQSQQMAWERVVMQMQFDHEAQKRQIQHVPREAPGWLREVTPMLVLGLGAALVARGFEGGSVIIEQMLPHVMGGEPDEDDENDEDVIDVEPEPKRSKKETQARQQSAEEFWEQNPLCGMLQILDNRLEGEAREAVKAVVPMSSWVSLEQAMKSKRDALAKAYMMQYVASTQDVLDDIERALPPNVLELHRDILTKVRENVPRQPKPEGAKKTSAPPPPPQPDDEETPEAEKPKKKKTKKKTKKETP